MQYIHVPNLYVVHNTKLYVNYIYLNKTEQREENQNQNIPAVYPTPLDLSVWYGRQVHVLKMAQIKHQLFHLLAYYLLSKSHMMGNKSSYLKELLLHR